MRYYRGTGRFTTSDDRFGGSTFDTRLVLLVSRPSFCRVTSVGIFFPRCECDRASDTPVATTCVSSSRLLSLPRGCIFAVRLLLGGWHGSEDSAIA
jgi:hypothetical protein